MLALGPDAQRRQVGMLRSVIEQWLNLGEVLQRALQDVFGCSKRALSGCNVDRSMERGHLGRQGVDVRTAEFVAFEQAACQCVLRKLAHLHRILQRSSAAAEYRCLDATGNGDNVEVERWRKTPIQP